MLPKDKSLAYHLLFPLLRLPHTSLGSPENHLNTFLSSHNTLVLELADRTSIQPRAFTHPNLVADYRAEGSQWLVYSVPEFTQELTLFREGKYSQFSPEAKKLFRAQWASNYTSLSIPPKGVDGKYLPLTPSQIEEALLYWSLAPDTTTAISYWVELLDIKPHILPADLYYLPTSEEYIDIDL